MTGPLQAGIYTRISIAAINDTTKLDDQERICRDLAERLGWEVVATYTDHSRSAWQLNRKRPGWDAMLADVEAGKINAIVTYHGDRLIRRHEDLSDLLRLSRTKGVRLASPTGERNLDNDDDQFVLEIEVSMAKRESANTSRRRKQQYERWRREGKVRSGGRGGRAFAFATDGITHIPGEVAIVREAAGRILAGEPTGSIARDLAARGVVTPAGRPMSHTTLRKMLARPRYAGLMPDGVSPAAWDPVLERETWEEVHAQLAVRALVVPAPSNTHRWLLSGIAECGTCGKPLQINAAHRRRRSEGPAYRCVNPGCRKVHRKAEFLDAYVTGRMAALLADPALAEATVPQVPGVAAELLALTQRRAEAEQVIASYAERPERLSVLARALDSIDDRIMFLRAEMNAGSGQRILSAHAGITPEEFKALPLGTRRALISAAYRVLVLPASRLGPGFRTEDVKMIRRSPGT